MKRLLLAVGLLALVVTACVLSNGCLRRNTAELLAYMEAAQEAYDREDKAACLEQSRRLAEAFPEKTRFFPFFLRHSDVNSLEQEIVTLPAFLEAGAWENFLPPLRAAAISWKSCRNWSCLCRKTSYSRKRKKRACEKQKRMVYCFRL